VTWTDRKGRVCHGSFGSEEEFLDFAIPSPPEGTDKYLAWEALNCKPGDGEHIFQGPGGFRVDANTAEGTRELHLFLHGPGGLPSIGTHCPECFVPSDPYDTALHRKGCRGWQGRFRLDLDRMPLLPPKGEMMTPVAPRCPATHRHVRRFGAEATGVQCKYEPGHEGDHCAFTFGDGDVFWPQEAVAPDEAEVSP